jgi:hypothetical protein
MGEDLQSNNETKKLTCSSIDISTPGSKTYCTRQKNTRLKKAKNETSTDSC